MYCAASEQKINVQKSSVMFRRNCLTELKNAIKEQLGFDEMKLGEVYVGLPVLWDNSKKEAFTDLLDCVCKKVQQWKDNFLTFAGYICW